MISEHGAELRHALQSNGDALLAYFERRCASREDAADLLAETMLQVWRRKDAFPTDPDDHRPWMFGFAANVLRNHRRGSVRRRALSDRLKEALRVHENREGLHLAEIGAVRDCVRSLPEQQRELVMLVHWDGCTIAEAATILGLNASTARSRYSAAKAGLRGVLGEEAGGSRAG